jgi:uncharacterized damage-inducible protein DinB
MSALKQLVLAQTNYTAWATRRVLNACSSLSLDQIESGLGASHSSVLGTLNHIYDGERVWLDRLKEDGVWRLPEDPAPGRSFEFLVQFWPELWLGYRQWIDPVSEADLTHEFTTLLPAEKQLRGPRWQIISHVVNHSTLHRGQIVTMLRTFGLKPPNVDFMSFYVTG